MIAEAVIAPGHDGQAELVLQVRYANGALGSVTLDEAHARALLESLGLDSVADLPGQRWQRLLEAFVHA